MAPATDAQIAEVSAAAHRGDAAAVMNLIATTPALVHAKEPINGWTPLHIFARLSLEFSPALRQGRTDKTTIGCWGSVLG